MTIGFVATGFGATDLAYNGVVSTSPWLNAFAADGDVWRMSAFQDTSLASIASATASIRFSAAQAGNDPFAFEISTDGFTWTQLERFGRQGVTPPTVLTTFSFDVGSIVDTPARANAVQMRLIGLGPQRRAEFFSISLDGMRLDVTGT